MPNRDITTLIIITTLWASPLCADEWFDKQRQSFDGFSQQGNAHYNEFRDKRDAEFSRWLAEQWREFVQFTGEVRDPAPKPATQPAVNPAARKASKAVAPHPPSKAAPPVSETRQIPQALTMDFLGHPVGIQLDEGVARVKLARVNKETIKAAWEQLAHAPHESTLYSLKHYREKLALSDWATTRLVGQLTQGVHPDANSRALLGWFLLSKLGYRVRAGMVNEQLVVLFAPAQKVYTLPYYQIDGARYHLLYGAAEGRLNTYRGQFDARARHLDLRFARSVVSGEPSSQRDITFQGKTITIGYDKNRIALFSSHPQIDLQHYFAAQPAAATAQSLKQQLTPLLQEKSELEKVNLLLAFVQLGLAYKLDDEQFGEENYLLPEETLHYPAADCEDRAVLFAWLVRELVGIPVVGLSYPGHVSTAVALSEAPDGADGVIEYRGNRYWPADPTYIGASVGQVMPQHRAARPEVIVSNNAK